MGGSRLYIDGQEGTTGLRIREWLAGRDDFELLHIDEARRKDPAARQELIKAADLTVLCLPDDAAREAAGWATKTGTRVLDASTAHRVDPNWVYGLPEIGDAQREAIASAERVSNPGCYPTAVVLALAPLIRAGQLDPAAPIQVHALSGYSGGGRSLIERWEDPERGLLQHLYEAPYAMDRVHKHVPEMHRYSGLTHEPFFVPAVGPFRNGMRVEIPLHQAMLESDVDSRSIHATLGSLYADENFVSVLPLLETLEPDETRFDPRACNETNRMEIAVVTNPLGHVLLIVTLDNLGKGAAGVAIQNLNLMLGLPETRGLPT